MKLNLLVAATESAVEWCSRFCVVAVLVACSDGAAVRSVPPNSDVTSGSGAALPMGSAVAIPAANGGANTAQVQPPSTTASSLPTVPPPPTTSNPMSGSAGAPAAEAPPTTGVPATQTPSNPDIVFEIRADIPPGAERMDCTYAQFPKDRGVIAVPSVESEFTPGSHHLLAYRTDLTDLPTDHTGVWDCTDNQTSHWADHMTGSYYEAQEPEARRDLPPGVAHRFQPGDVALIQAHYINSGADMLAADARITLHTADLSTVPIEAGTFLFTDTNILVPPGAKSRSTMSCPLPSDITPALIWAHMHKQGVNFVATTDDAAAAASLGTLYATTDWAEPQPRTYPNNPPVTLHAGTHITFSCDYQNPTSSILIYGNSAATNEMCVLHGMYWPRMSIEAENCKGFLTSVTAIP